MSPGIGTSCTAGTSTVGIKNPLSGGVVIEQDYMIVSAEELCTHTKKAGQ